MSRVLAASVKAAVCTAAMKQVAAAGFLLQKSSTSWSGKTAYAVWSIAGTKRSGDPIVRDGRIVYPSKQVMMFRINYPALVDDALLTRSEADLIAAYTLHETGHVIHTANEPLRHFNFYSQQKLRNPYARLHKLANGFEDARMEACVILHGARNAKVMFTKLMNKITADITKDFNPCDLANAPFTVAILGREALGNGNTYTSQLLSRIPEPQRSIYAAAVSWFADAPLHKDVDTSYWSYRMADEFLVLWDAMRKQNPTDKPEEPEQGDEPDGPKPQPLQPDEPDDEGQSPGPYELDDEQDDPEQGDEPDDEEFGESGDSEPGEGDGDDEQFDDSDMGGDEADEQSDGAGQSDDPADSGDEDGEAGDEDGDEPPDQSKPFDQQGDGEGEMKSPEPSIDDLFKRINKRTDSALDVKMSAFSPADIEVDIFDLIK